MQRGVSQLLFTYTPDRTVNWEGGEGIVKLTSVRLADVWEDRRAELVREQVSAYQERWRRGGGVVDQSFPDPVESPYRFAVGTPEGVQAALVPTALICTRCRAFVFPKGHGAGSLERARCPNPNCHSDSLRQYGQVFVHGCGNLVPVSEWMPDASRKSGYWEPINLPLRCSRCGDGGLPAIRGKTDRARDTRVECLRCGSLIKERLTARCHRCLQAIPREERRVRNQSHDQSGSETDDAAESHPEHLTGSVLSRILMRLTNFQANDAYYVHSTSILRLDTPTVVATDDADVTLLRSLIAPHRRPGIMGQREAIADLTERMNAALAAGDTATAQELTTHIMAALSRDDSQADQEGGREEVQAPDFIASFAPDLHQAIEESIAAKTRVHGRPALDLAIADSGATGLLREEILALTKRLGLTELRVIEDLPILTATFGYSRRTFEPTYEERNICLPTTLQHFGALSRDAARALGQASLEGRIPVLAREGVHEALYLGLDPSMVCGWIEANGVSLPRPEADPRVRIMVALEDVEPQYRDVWVLPARRLVFGLVHSLSHAVMRATARHAGLERTSLAEYLFLPLLAVAVYVSSSAVYLGNIDLMARAHLYSFLRDVVATSPECPTDPDCIDHNGACAMCLHSPEICCRVFNRGLSRAFLIGGHVPWQPGKPEARLIGYWEYVERVQARCE